MATKYNFIYGSLLYPNKEIQPGNSLFPININIFDTMCNANEKIFGMLMEVVGIFAYSWALTSVSNYVKILNEKTEEYEKKKKVLEEIKITYPQLSDDLYDRISRFIKYKHDKEQLDKNIIQLNYILMKIF